MANLNANMNKTLWYFPKSLASSFSNSFSGERGYYQAPAYQPSYPDVGGGYVNVHDNHADPSYTNTVLVPAGLNTHYSEQVHHMQTAGGYQQANGYSDSGYVANGETFGDVGEVNVHTPGSTYKEGTSAYNGQALDVQAASVVSNPLDNMVDQANGAYSNGYNNNYNNGYNNSPSYSSGYNSAPEPYAEPTYGGYESERGKGKGKPSKNDKKREKEMKKNKKKADKAGKKNKKRQEKESKKSQKRKDKGGKKAEKENKKNKKKAAKKAKKTSKQIARSMGMRPGTFNREAFMAAHSQ